MKQTRLAVIGMLIAVCGFSWFLLGRQTADSLSQTKSLIEQGHAYQERGLYEKAIESYQGAIASQPSPELYEALVQTCEAYYAEEPTSSVENTLLEAYDLATAACPDQVAYWERYAQICLDDEDYDRAASVLRAAQQADASSETLTAQWQQAYYSVDDRYQRYEGISLTENEGAYTVQTGGLYGTVEPDGSTLLDQAYTYIGPVGEDGVALCSTAEGEIQLFDADGVMVGRTSGTAEEARAYSEGLVPVRLQGRQDWCYLDTEGDELLSGYQQASCFQNGKAAVQLDTGEWCLIDSEGNRTGDATWEEVRLDPAGRWLQGDVMLLKTDGSWKIADSDGEPVEGFSCEDIDVCLNGEPIAFCQGGQWGFVETDGTVLIQPAYSAARSFSGGVAAAQTDDGWDYIDEQGTVVIDGNFAEAGYFSNDSGTCPVMENADAPEWYLLVWNVAR